MVNLNKFELKIVRLLLKGVPLSKDDLFKYIKDEKIVSSAVSSLLESEYIQHEYVPRKPLHGTTYQALSGRYIIKNKSACVDAILKKRNQIIMNAFTILAAIGAWIAALNGCSLQLF